MCTAAVTSSDHRFVISTKPSFKNISLKTTWDRISPVHTNKLHISAPAACMNKRASFWDCAAPHMCTNMAGKSLKLKHSKGRAEQRAGLQSSHQGGPLLTVGSGSDLPLLLPWRGLSHALPIHHSSTQLKVLIQGFTTGTVARQLLYF